MQDMLAPLSASVKSLPELGCQFRSRCPKFSLFGEPDLTSSRKYLSNSILIQCTPAALRVFKHYCTQAALKCTQVFRTSGAPGLNFKASVHRLLFPPFYQLCSGVSCLAIRGSLPSARPNMIRFACFLCFHMSFLPGRRQALWVSGCPRVS